MTMITFSTLHSARHKGYENFNRASILLIMTLQTLYIFLHTQYHIFAMCYYKLLHLVVIANIY